MDSQKPDVPTDANSSINTDANADANANADASPDTSADQELMEDDEEFEVTREELIAALQEVVTNLSNGLKGAERDEYVSADDLAQNDWFFAGASDEEGQYAITMWPAEGEDDMLRIDIGTESDVHQLAASPDQVAALTDDFIEAMSEDYEDEEYDDEDEDEDEEDEDEDEDEDEEGEFEEEDYEEEPDTVEEDTSPSKNGNRVPPR